MKRLLGITLVAFCAMPAIAQVQPPEQLLKAEQERIEVMARAATTTVAVFDSRGQGGGSGVVISPDGFALTNFHVAAPSGSAMKCGMADGRIYDAVIVGVDPVGDVALIQLLGRDDFSSAPLGDSESVQVGDWVFAAGNPFLLADDLTPSISYGIVSGVRRYQYPAGTLLEYTDCIQTDAAINPGNSGGPLFDRFGRLIGINGRGSFEKRGRVNVGVGYAISINQIKRFLSHLKSGRIVDHAALGATVSTAEEGQVVVDDILETSDPYRRGLRYNDELVRFARREMTSANRLKNVLGVFPSGWIVPITYRREGKTRDTAVRLMGLHDRSQLWDLIQQEKQKPTQPPEGELPRPKNGEDDKRPAKPVGRRLAQPEMPAIVAERYVARRGYANYWYNRREQERLWKTYRGLDGLEAAGYEWSIRGETPEGEPFEIQMQPTGASMRSARGNFAANFAAELDRQLSPPGSGGLLLAIHLWQRMLDKGPQRFGEVYYLGQLPSSVDGPMAECLVGVYDGIEIRFLFSLESGDLMGIDLFPNEAADPCELRLDEYDEISGRRVPTRLRVHFGDQEIATLQIQQWSFGG